MKMSNSTFYEEDKAYVSVLYTPSGVRQTTFFFFRDGVWIVNEAHKEEWENSFYENSRSYVVQGFIGPLDSYIEMMRGVDDKLQVKKNVGDTLDAVLFGVVNEKAN